MTEQTQFNMEVIAVADPTISEPRVHHPNQGDWVFVPAPELRHRRIPFILCNEVIRRGGEGTHVCDQLIRIDGETVFVHPRWAPLGLREDQHRRLIARNQLMRDGWRAETESPVTYVQGKVRHPELGTLELGSWHRVYTRAEYLSRA